MALPAQFTTAIATSDFDLAKWIEIEGIPNAFGTVAKTSSWFASRAAASQFALIRAYLKGTPSNFDAQLDVLEGIANHSGTVEFTITDVDGEQTLWAGAKDDRKWLFLAADITAAGATITTTGTVDNAYYPTTGGVLYIGNETIAYGSRAGNTFSTCVRGQYRSRAQAWKTNAIISWKPVTMYGRRVWYYLTATARGLNVTPTDADKALRFSGTIETYALDEADPGAYVLTAVSIEKELATKKLFRDLRSVADLRNQGIAGPEVTVMGFSTITGIRLASSGSPPRWDLLSNDDCAQLNEDGTAHFVNGDTILFRVDDEIIAFLSQSSSTPPSLKMIARGVMGTTIAEHKPGFTMKEIAWCARYLAAGPVEHTASRLAIAETSVANPSNPTDHPLIFLLCVLASTGTGTNEPGGDERDYDCLPASWGLGIDYTRIDYAAIERLAEEHPDLRIGGIFERPMTFIELAGQVLAPFGFYAVTELGDVFTIRKLEAPMLDEATRVISRDSIISGSRPKWDANLLGLVQQIDFRYGRDIAEGLWLFDSLKVNVHGEQYAQGNGRTLTYDMPLVYPLGSQRIPGKPALGGMANIEEALEERIDFFLQAYTVPPPVLVFLVDFTFLDVEPGDLLSVTHPNLPQVQTGARGLTSQVMRCMSKSIDDASTTVELVLQDVGYDFGSYRYWAPALEITAFNAGAKTITVSLTTFTEPRGSMGTDLLPKDNAGTAHNLHSYIAASGVHLVSKDFKTRTALTGGSSVNTATGVITCVDALPGGLAVGDFVMIETQGYAADITAFQTAPWYAAFLDDGDDLLADGVSDAARWAP